jgi:hypothetical protein
MAGHCAQLAPFELTHGELTNGEPAAKLIEEG